MRLMQSYYMWWSNPHHVLFVTGTVIFYQPGMLMGGPINHDCSTQRSIGYYLEAVLCLAPFAKKPLQCVFKGVTNDQQDPSVSMIMS